MLDLGPVLRILMLRTAPFACAQLLVQPQHEVSFVRPLCPPGLRRAFACELSPHVLLVLSFGSVLLTSIPRTRSPCLRRPRRTTLVLSLSLPSLRPPPICHCVLLPACSLSGQLAWTCLPATWHGCPSSTEARAGGTVRGKRASARKQLLRRLRCCLATM